MNIMAETRDLLIKDLIDARALLRKGWIAHEFACDSQGRPVSYERDDACAFCMEGALMGAIFRANGDYIGPEDIVNGNSNRYQRAMYPIASVLRTEFGHDGNIASFNDNRCDDQEQAIAIFTKAIQQVVNS